MTGEDSWYCNCAEGFTGSYQGRPVSVQSVGMGVPSAAIYYTELIRFYGCERLIRVGSCGGISDKVELGDVIVATAAGTDSAAIATINGGIDLPPVADWAMLRAAVEAAEAASIEVAVGPVFTSDLFYGPESDAFATPFSFGASVWKASMQSFAADWASNSTKPCLRAARTNAFAGFQGAHSSINSCSVVPAGSRCTKSTLLSSHLSS